MKALASVVVCVGLALFASATAQATLFAYDGFEEYAPALVEDGPNGSAGVGLNGGFGWGGAYDVNNFVKSLVRIEDRTALPVVYTNGEIHIDGGVRALRTYDVANGSPLLLRPLATIQTPENPVYFSFLFRTNNASPLDTPDFFQVGFDNTATALNPRISIGANTQEVNGALPFRFFARTTTTVANSSFSLAPEIQAATTYFLVGRVRGNPTGNFNLVDLFVNPATLLEPTTPSASISGNSGFRLLSHFLIRTDFLENGDGYVVDELRIGGDYASVIPEPSVAVLLLSALALLGGRRPPR